MYCWQLYEAYADYHDMMSLAEELVEKCARAVNGSTSLVYQVCFIICDIYMLLFFHEIYHEAH
jgi:lysyl-tRNA synthetase class II